MDHFEKLEGLIEIFGEAGTGKTQICVQLAKTYLINHEESSVLYICTEGPFNIRRFYDFVPDSHRDDVGRRLIIERIYDDELFLRFIKHVIPRFIQHSKIGLIVVDSIAALFRHHEDQIYLRSALFNVSKILRRLTAIFPLKIVVTNQVSTCLINSLINVPSLGHIWSNCIDHRIFLGKRSNYRFIEFLHSSTIPEGYRLNFIISNDSVEFIKD